MNFLIVFSNTDNFTISKDSLSKSNVINIQKHYEMEIIDCLNVNTYDNFLQTLTILIISEFVII